MNAERKQELQNLLNTADVEIINMSGGRISILEKTAKTYKKGSGKYHPTNKDRDQEQYSSPSLIRFITAPSGVKRVIVLGSNFPGTEKHATIDISWDPVVVATWQWWCLESDFPSRDKNGEIEHLQEFLVDPTQHSDWQGSGFFG
jgi:hypothetical protein